LRNVIGYRTVPKYRLNNLFFLDAGTANIRRNKALTADIVYPDYPNFRVDI